MTRRLRFEHAPARLAVVAGLLLAPALTGCAGAESDASAASDVRIIENGSGRFKGIELGKPLVLPAARFTDTAGQVVAWPKGGRPWPVTILLFAYTSCPDTCQTQMADVSAAIRGLASDDQGKAGVVMVTVDPGTDTGPVLRTFLDQFSAQSVGLRAADEATLASAAEALGVVLEDDEDESASPGTSAQASGGGPAGGARGGAGGRASAAVQAHGSDHAIGHGDQLIAFGPDGTAEVVWRPGTEVAVIRSDIQTLLEGR